MQKRISILQQYSNEWGLELNLSKTKIMIVNKQGATIRKFKFYFQGQEIEIVKQRILYKSEGKTVNTYLNLIDTTIKPVVLYACES